MADDHCRIRVGDHQVGIIGLGQAMDAIAQSHADNADEDVQAALLDMLSKKNYIPNSAGSDYGQAFVREFRKFLGRPYEEPAAGPLHLVVLGPGCSQCNRLEQTVMQVLNEMGLPASLEHVTDLKEIAKYGFVSTPALVINGKIAAMGTVPAPRKIKELLASAGLSQKNEECSCLSAHKDRR